MRPHLITKAKKLMMNHMHDEAAKVLRMEMSQHVIDIFMIDRQCTDVFSPNAMRSIPEIDLSSLQTDTEYSAVTSHITVPSCVLERPVVFERKSKYLNLLGIDRDSATFVEMDVLGLSTPKAKDIPWIVALCPALAPLFFIKEEPIVPKRHDYKRNTLKNELCVELNSGKFIDISRYTNYSSLDNQNHKALVVDLKTAIVESSVRVNDKRFHTIKFEDINAIALLYIYALANAGGYISNSTR